MKRLILFALAILPFVSFAQKTVAEKDVPAKFTKDFQRNYAGVTNAKWFQIDSASYEVKFVNNDMNTSVLFRNTSMETRWEVKPEYVPASIKTFIDTTYLKSKINYAYILDISKNKSYEVGIKEKKNEYLLTFGIDGKFKNAVKKENTKASKKVKKVKDPKKEATKEKASKEPKTKEKK